MASYQESGAMRCNVPLWNSLESKPSIKDPKWSVIHSLYNELFKKLHMGELQYSGVMSFVKMIVVLH